MSKPMTYDEMRVRLKRAERRRAMWSWAWFFTILVCLLIGWWLLLCWWLR